MKRFATTLAPLAIAAAYSTSLDAQTIRDSQSSASLRDSLVLVDAQGSCTVSYPRTQIFTEVSKVKSSAVQRKDKIWTVSSLTPTSSAASRRRVPLQEMSPGI